MFEVEFRPPQRRDVKSTRCSKLLILWFTVIAIIAVLFITLSPIWSSVITVVILIAVIWFTWYYFHSAPPETEQVEEHCAVENGLSPTDIAEIPSFPYQRYSGYDSTNSNGKDRGVGWLQCAVCIATVKEGEMVRQLAMCKHMFHVTCIDKWFQSHMTCPMCRADVKSGELSSTPLLPPV